MTDPRALIFLNKTQLGKYMFDMKRSIAYRILLKVYPSKLLEYINSMFQDAVSYRSSGITVYGTSNYK